MSDPPIPAPPRSAPPNPAMSPSGWAAWARARAAAFADEDGAGPLALRRCLALYAELLDLAPSSLHARHGSEPALSFEARTRVAKDRLLRDDFRLAQDGASGDLLRSIAHQARAADDLLGELVGFKPPEEPDDPGPEWCVDSASTPRFVIPRAVQRRPSTSKAGVRTRTVDLIRRHTILPVRTGAYDVRLTWRDLDLTKAAGFAATLYDNLELDCPPRPDGFRVEGVACADHREQLLEGLQRSAEAQAAVWMAPELTLDPAGLAALVHRLGRRADWDPSPKAWPALSVPGSMHIDDETGVARNRAPVLDAQGFPILPVDKLLAFEDPEVGTEDIGGSDTLQVLATPSAVIGFGICRDFCERALPSPFEGLDLDYVLVPSFGDAVSMQGHIATAADLQIRERTRAFVVQQASPPPPHAPGTAQPLGYVLPPRGSLGATVASVLVSERWSLHPTD